LRGAIGDSSLRSEQALQSQKHRLLQDFIPRNDTGFTEHLPLKFDNDLTGFTELEKLIGKLSIPDNGNILLGMEATGHYWFPLYELLKSKGYQVKVFNPLKVNRFRDFYIQPTKTDPKDAFVIANILRYAKLKPTHLPPKNIQRLTRVLRYRRFLTDEMAQVKNKIRCMLDEIFPEYQSIPFFFNLFGQTSRALLKMAPIPEKILALPKETWAEYLFSHSKGRLRWERALRKANFIYQAARSSIGSKVVASTLEECTRDLVYELRASPRIDSRLLREEFLPVSLEWVLLLKLV